MHKIKTWGSKQMAQVSRLDVLAPLFEVLDGGMILGALIGGALFFLLGALFGALNRGVAGALVGALSAGILGILVGGLIGNLFRSRQGQVQASLDLKEGSGEYGPHDTVSGYVVLSPTRSGRIQGGKVLLVCRGFYAHDEDEDEDSSEPRLVRNVQTYHVQELPVIPPGTVRRGSPVRYPFRCELPQPLLPTHHGFGCSVRWSLHVDLDNIDEASNLSSQEIFVRAVTPIGVGARPERVSTASAVGELVMALPRTTYAEGETLQGRLIVDPKDDFVARELRVLLLRVEHNPQGHDHVVYISGWNPDTGRFRGESRAEGQGTTYVWLEDEVDVAEEVGFAEGEKRLFDFKFHLPQQWRPTLHTEHGDVSWRVVATLARGNGRDLRVQQAITMHTGAPHIARVMASELSVGDAAGAE